MYYKLLITIAQSEPIGSYRVTVVSQRQAGDDGEYEAYQHLSLEEALDVVNTVVELRLPSQLTLW
jgi:hypothetical protein